MHSCTYGKSAEVFCSVKRQAKGVDVDSYWSMIGMRFERGPHRECEAKKEGIWTACGKDLSRDWNRKITGV